MLRSTLALLLLAAPLCAQELEFKPLPVSPSSGNINPSSLLITWDKPETAPAKLEVYIFHTAWMVSPSVDETCPKWREMLFAENFDAEAFAKANGPETTRHRFDIAADNVPLGVIDHEEEFRIRNVAVLFVDAAGKRSVPKTLRASVEVPGLTRADCLYLPSHLPHFTPTRLFDKKPSKLKWTLPALGPSYEIEKVLFVGAENMISSYHASRVKDGIAGWLAGNDDYSKPMVQELAKDATSCWIKDLNFKSCTVLVRTKGGLYFACPFEQWTNSYEAQAGEEDQKALPAIELKPAEPGKKD
ncbi:MAG: hypothetical protein IT463_10935 [Planctomycetes bacterium]|nr:hypothetical protein [Planctomycetota bacterium]